RADEGPRGREQRYDHPPGFMRITRRSFTCLLVALAGCRDERDGTVEVTLAAAASLRVVLPALIEGFAADHPRARIRPSYGASGDVRKRVEDGAPYDAVMMASAEPVADLVASGHVLPDSRRVVARNDLVLIAPKARPSRLTF